MYARAAPMLTRLAAAAAIVFFLATAFRSGWRRVETDFPNYYTAAVCIRKGLPLRNFYDWTWFQRQINFAGVEKQLGGFPPHTPLTAVPMVPLASFPFQTAKRIWITFSLACLAATIFLLTRLTGFASEKLVLLAFLGFGALYTNFLYGQYYVFLLFLLTLAMYCLERGRSEACGFLCGVMFGLKLYGGPFLLYFLVKRDWRGAAGFAASVAGMGALAIGLFGYQDIYFYVSQILPRALNGEIIDPYNPVNQTFSTLVRHFLFFEPELNPHPIWNAPLAVFFLQPLFTFLIAAMTLIGLWKHPSRRERQDFAWFCLATLLVSMSTSSYTFIVLVLPVALLLREAVDVGDKVFLIAAFVALTFPIWPGSYIWFPRLWVSLALFIFVGRRYWRGLSPRLLTTAVAVCAVLASVSAWKHYAAYQREPGRRYEVVAMQPGAIFSNWPTISKSGLFYQSLGGEGYVLRWLHDGVNEKLAFDGEAFLPHAASPDGPVYFELVGHQNSSMMAFDPSTRRVSIVESSVAPSTALAESHLVTSPDGKWSVRESASAGWTQIWLKDQKTGAERVLTAGSCNNTSPVWELDSSAVIFASDCDRSTGLPALYRAKVTKAAPALNRASP
jgi:hypothetical protein